MSGVRDILGILSVVGGNQKEPEVCEKNQDRNPKQKGVPCIQKRTTSIGWKLVWPASRGKDLEAVFAQNKK